MKGFISIATSVLLSLPAFAFAPWAVVGESADYKLVKNRARTSGVIKRGSIHTEVVAHNPADPNGPSYSVGLDYSLRVSFVGNKEGKMMLNAPEEFFSESFMERLRTENEIVTPDFKIRHIGFGDVKTSNGRSYEECDKVYLYDIKTIASQGGLFGLARELLSEAAAAKLGTLPQNTQIEDMEIVAHVKNGVPVLGAVQIDMKGRANGYSFKAGFDYAP